MKILIAAILSAALLYLVPSPAANLNNSEQRDNTQAVQAESPRNDISVPDLQEKAPTEQQVVSEPESTTVQEKPVVPTVGCEAYRSLLEQYEWDVRTAMAVMRAESGCNKDSLSPTADRGLMQINSVHADMVNYDLSKLFDPSTNIQVAHRVYLSQGWNGWSAFKNGSYLKFL